MLLRFVFLFLFFYGHATFCSTASGQAVDKADSIQLHYQAKTDSLKNALKLSSSLPTDTLNQLTNKTKSIEDSLRRYTTIPDTGLQRKLDSLQSLNLPQDKYKQKADSLVNAYETKAAEKVSNLKSKITDKLSGTKSKLTDSLSTNGINTNQLEQKFSETGQQLPAANLPTDLPEELSISQPDFNAEVSEQLEGLKQEVPEVENPLEEESAKVKNEVEELKAKPKEELQPITEEVKGVTDEVNDLTTEVGEVTGEVSAVSNEVQAAKEGDYTALETRAEEEVLNQTDVGEELNKQAFEEHKNQIEEQLKVAEQYQDQELVKQRILEKSKGVANDILAKYKEQVARAQIKASLESLPQISNADTLIDFKKKRRQEKKLRDRVFTGLELEISHDEFTRLDFAPLFGYKIRPAVHVHLGYVYRVRFSSEDRALNQDNTIFGPRGSFMFDFWKSFYAKTSVDLLRSNTMVGTDESSREWVPGLYFGIGKHYYMSKFVRGDIFAMVNVLHKKDKTPFASPFNFRFNFYVDFNKRPPKPDWKKKWNDTKRKVKAPRPTDLGKSKAGGSKN